MPVDGEAASRRDSLSAGGPIGIVLTRCHDGTYAVQLPCKRGHSHIAIVEVMDEPGCPAAHFAPGTHYQYDGTFTPTHDVDHDDSAAIATINSRAGLLATTDARTAAGGPEPVDLF